MFDTQGKSNNVNLKVTILIQDIQKKYCLQSSVSIITYRIFRYMDQKIGSSSQIAKKEFTLLVHNGNKGALISIDHSTKT